jgi:hypothetical protein
MAHNGWAFDLDFGAFQEYKTLERAILTLAWKILP